MACGVRMCKQLTAIEERRVRVLLSIRLRVVAAAKTAHTRRQSVRIKPPHGLVRACAVHPSWCIFRSASHSHSRADGLVDTVSTVTTGPLRHVHCHFCCALCGQ
jgi:hypothetical protein